MKVFREKEKNSFWKTLPNTLARAPKLPDIILLNQEFIKSIYLFLPFWHELNI